MFDDDAATRALLDLGEKMLSGESIEDAVIAQRAEAPGLQAALDRRIQGMRKNSPALRGVSSIEIVRNLIGTPVEETGDDPSPVHMSKGSGIR